jgi:hypothetical protein
MSLLELFCHVDDFCQTFVPLWEQRRRRGQLYLSEIMTIIIHFHQMRFRERPTILVMYCLISAQIFQA